MLVNPNVNVMIVKCAERVKKNLIISEEEFEDIAIELARRLKEWGITHQAIVREIRILRIEAGL